MSATCGRKLSKGRIAVVVTAAGLCFLTSVHAADVDIDLRAGYYADKAEGPFVGGGVLTRVGTSGRWFFNPNLELAFGDHVDVFSANGDFRYDLPVRSSLAMWVGGGPAIVHYDPDSGHDSDTDLGLNGFFAVGTRSGNVRPFFQVKVVLSDENEIVVGGGIRF